MGAVIGEKQAKRDDFSNCSQAPGPPPFHPTLRPLQGEREELPLVIDDMRSRALILSSPKGPIPHSLRRGLQAPSPRKHRLGPGDLAVRTCNPGSNV